LASAETILIKNIDKLVTCEPELYGSSDPDAPALGIIEDASVLIAGGRITWAGSSSDLKALESNEPVDARITLDGSGLVALPGLVDCHTHAVFAGTREREYEMRMKGVPYMEIARRGGGIISTVSSVRSTSTEKLVQAALPRLKSMLACGTTTVEIKSGYGLDLESELKQLEAIRRVGRESPLDVVPTFLGAHEFPPEYKNDRRGYMDLVINEMIPAVSERGLAEFCDVFCEEGVFTADESREILLAAKGRGLKPKIHADEFVDSGGALVAADVGAVSAEHLYAASREGLEAMKKAGTVAVLLPGVSIGLGKCEFADARGMIDMGLDVAFGTDFNPGSSMTNSLTLMSSLACSYMRVTPEEAVLGLTLKAARALGRGGEIGSIKPGKQGDIALFDIPDFRYIPYHFGGDTVRTVVKNGTVVWERQT
jgi:imidazolonepropionase